MSWSWHTRLDQKFAITSKTYGINRLEGLSVTRLFRPGGMKLAMGLQLQCKTKWKKHDWLMRHIRRQEALVINIGVGSADGREVVHKFIQIVIICYKQILNSRYYK